MSAFEITVTPTRLKGKKNVESREPTAVVMAPFSEKAIVQFENVPVTKTAKRILRIINTSDEDIKVKVNKPISDEHNLSIEWTANVVPAHNEVPMELVWNPLFEVTCRETLQLTDDRNFQKDVMIILKSISNKPAKNTRKFPTVGKTLQLKSPTGGMKSKKVVAQLQQRKHSQKDNTNTTSSTVKKQQWRHPFPEKSVKVYAAKNDDKTARQSVAKQAPLTELNHYSNTKDYKEPFVVSPQMNIAKENVIPVTPQNMLNLIEEIQFTPVTNTISNAGLLVEDFASLPTPVERDYNISSKENKLIDVRPRCLTATELFMEAEDETRHCNIVTNKTYDIKLSDSINASTDTLDNSRNDAHSHAASLNKTTTIAAVSIMRPLDVIREEEAGSPPSSDLAQTGRNEQKIHDLKRDIKMVGSPLRKFSESMKNLSFSSPQTKLAIQGSMPNLNEMEQIRSIEQNRYFQQQNLQIKPQSSHHRQEQQHSVNFPNKPSSKTHLLDSLTDACSSSESSLISPAELMFNHNEILAQSSRFNLNEVGIKSRKNSPISSKSNVPTTTTKVTTPTKAARIHKRRLHELSFSDSPSTESLSAVCGATITTMSEFSKVSPPKKQRLNIDDSVMLGVPTKPSGPRIKNWSQAQPKKFKLAYTLSLTKKPMTPRKIKEEPRVRLYDSDLYLQTYINPDPFAATTTSDPFLASTMYLDARAVDKHQADFKKWLNALVSIPADLDADCNTNIDVGKLFNEVRNKELILAPTKEEQSMNYLTQFRLESLRRAAVQLFLSEEMRAPCSKVAVYVSKHAIRIRSDRNLHLDVVMQRYLLELLLCFNPLWLRLGLEVVYGEKIHLHSNNDIVGLSTFILNRLFRDKFLEQKYSKAYTLSDEYADHIKKFTLQKLLFLLLFLDKAKQQRIVRHNPCLFVKKSPHKETKDILLRFSSELLANVGDITRDLKRLGYVLLHKQTYLDEFDYAFNNLAVDLRDGVRLTRVMEIILLREGLSKQLRVPAISRLQRIFNVNLALRALSDADFQLKGEIAANDIVDGHREKTLSLLWQVIYKFRSPKFHAAARVLQQWWRHSWLRVVIMRRIRYKEQQRREYAATKIQAAFRGHLARKYFKVYKEERIQASIVLQKYLRRFLAQKQLFHCFKAIVLIQRWYRAQRCGNNYRQNYLRLQQSAIFLQRTWRRRLFAQKLMQAAETAKELRSQRVQAAVLCIQTRWRAFIVGRRMRSEFKQKRASSIRLQHQLRAIWAMRKQRAQYVHMRNSVIQIQRRYRANKLMRAERIHFEDMRNIVIKLQNRWRALHEMKAVRAIYLQKLGSIIYVQRYMRAKWAMRAQRTEYQMKQQSVRIIQSYYRAHLAMKQQTLIYKEMRRKIIYIQRKWRAILLMRRQRNYYKSLLLKVRFVQQKYRATILMRQQRTRYQELRKVTIQMQLRYRSKMRVRKAQTDLKRILNAGLTIQRHFRAYKQMRFERAKYRGTCAAVACLQLHIRGYFQMKRLRLDFQNKRKAAIVLQRFFRLRQLTFKQRANFLNLKTAALIMQRRRRATLLMRQQLLSYQHQRTLIIAIQRRFRAKLYARQVRKSYAATLCTIVRLQRRFRATSQMRICRTDYINTRKKILTLQIHFRAYLAMKRARRSFQTQRNAATILQRWFRGILRMRRDKQSFERIRSHLITIQRKWRATLVARMHRKRFVQTIEKVRTIQRVLRATLLMRRERQHFERQRQATIVLQRRFRAWRLMLQVRSQYLLIRSLVICIQRKFRSHRLMLVQREQFLLLKRTTIHLQQKYRGCILMREERNQFQLLRRTTILFQANARGFLARKCFQALMTPEMVELLRRKKAAKIIQRYWRGYRIRKRYRTAAIVALRKRIAKSKQEASVAESIRSKVLDAVKFLRGRFNTSEALSILMRLDRLSRTVPHLLMTRSEFISTFCYGIMAQAIRSEVDKQLIECSSRIILNLARYNSTTANTFQESGLVTVAQMLMRWCDKDCEIFNTLCTLIWIFAHCSKKRKIIRDFMSTTDAIFMVRETKKLVARKEKMKQNVRKSTVAVTRSAQHQSFSARALPSLEPDFGIICNRPYTFISSVFAFDTILSKLGMDIW